MNIYCFSTLSFAKLQFKSVINKAFHKHGVASFTDAWIETNLAYNKETHTFESHLLQMRGLKHLTDAQKTQVEVASFTDAWIETKEMRHRYQHPKSHLLQMRGLKQNTNDISGINFYVASFTDAWIETDPYQIQKLE